MTKQEALQAKKAYLLKQIELQRLAISDSKEQWLAYTTPIDHYWQTFIKLRKIALLGAGALIIFTLKKPSRALKLSKTAFKTWGITRLVQRLFTTTDQTI